MEMQCQSWPRPMCCTSRVADAEGLDVACTDGHSDVVRLLLEAGANANIHNSLLVTPLHLAALGKFTAVSTNQYSYCWPIA